MNRIDTVQQIYAAFGRGDVPYILSQLADDVQWEYGASASPVPWLQPLRGCDQVPKFFEALFAHVDLTRFEVVKLFGDGDTVVDLVDL